MQRLELGESRGGFGTNSAPRAPRRKLGGTNPVPAKSSLSPGLSTRRGGPEGSLGRHGGRWTPGPPRGAHSLLSTGCCRHISLPAEMMGR